MGNTDSQKINDKDQTGQKNDRCSVCSEDFPLGDECPAIIQCCQCSSKYHFECWKQLLDKSETCVGEKCDCVISLDNSESTQRLNLSYEDLPNLKSIKIIDDALECMDSRFSQRQTCCFCFSLKQATLIVCLCGIMNLINGFIFFHRLGDLLANAAGHHYKGIIFIGVSVQLMGIVYGLISIVVFVAITVKSPYRGKYIGHLTLISMASAMVNVIFSLSQFIYIFCEYHGVSHWDRTLKMFVGGSTFNLFFNGFFTFYFATCILSYHRQCSYPHMDGLENAPNEVNW